MSKCYRCKSELTNFNTSIEHIILNALGGRLKSKSLLCKDCNKHFGNTIDAELFNRLHSLVSLLGLDRERGTIPDIKNVISASGKRHHLEEGRNPILAIPEIKIDMASNTIYVSAQDEKQLLHIIGKLKKKHSWLDDENVLQKARRHSEYMDELVTILITLGGDNFDRAVIKTVVNFYLHKGRQMSLINDVIPVLDEAGNVPKSRLHHYYTDPFCLNKQSGVAQRNGDRESGDQKVFCLRRAIQFLCVHCKPYPILHWPCVLVGISF